MLHTRFLLIGLLAVALFTSSARQAPAEEPWTLLGFDDTRWITGPITEDPSGTMYVLTLFFDAGQYNSGLYRLRRGETEWTLIELQNGIGNFFAPASGTILMQSRHDINRSLDGGDTWSLVYHDENIITSMIQLRTGEFAAPCLDHYVISSDLGVTWTSHPITTTDLALEIGFDGPDRIYVIDEYHIFRSEDGGSSWQVIYEVFDVEAWVGHMRIDSEGTLYCHYGSAFSGASNFLCSTDHGNTWSNLSNFMSRYAIASTDEIFALKLGSSGIQRSTDQGQTWITDFADAPYYDDPDFYGVLGLSISPADTLYVHSSVGLYRYGIKVPVELSLFKIE